MVQPMIKCPNCALLYDNGKGPCPHCSSKPKPGLLKRQRQQAHDSGVFAFSDVMGECKECGQQVGGSIVRVSRHTAEEIGVPPFELFHPRPHDCPKKRPA
jgi:hypothetical protein